MTNFQIYNSYFCVRCKFVIMRFECMLYLCKLCAVIEGIQRRHWGSNAKVNIVVLSGFILCRLIASISTHQFLYFLPHSSQYSKTIHTQVLRESVRKMLQGHFKHTTKAKMSKICCRMLSVRPTVCLRLAVSHWCWQPAFKYCKKYRLIFKVWGYC